MSARVSVLLACRDGERHLEESLSSLTGQTHGDVEIVAVNDGSRDATGRILEAFAASHPRTVVLETSGVGLAAALNLAATRATGTLFARQDADDRSRPERIARQVAFLEAHPEIAAVGTCAQVIDDAGRSVGPYPVPVGSAAIRRMLRRAPPFVHGSVMLRADTFRAAGGYRPAFAASQDFDLWLRLPATLGLANLGETLYQWRRHPGGVFSRDRGSQLRFAALARAFAAERAERGADCYDALERAADFDTFLATYRDRDRLALMLGEALTREGRVREARRVLGLALASPRTAMAAAAWWGLTLAVGLTPRARDAAR